MRYTGKLRRARTRSVTVKTKPCRILSKRKSNKNKHTLWKITHRPVCFALSMFFPLKGTATALPTAAPALPAAATPPPPPPPDEALEDPVLTDVAEARSRAAWNLTRGVDQRTQPGAAMGCEGTKVDLVASREIDAVLPSMLFAFFVAKMGRASTLERSFRGGKRKKLDQHSSLQIGFSWNRMERRASVRSERASK